MHQTKRFHFYTRIFLILSIAVFFHKYGHSYADITQQAIDSIDALNNKTTCSDSFFRQSEAIKELLQTTPVKLTKCPPFGRSITFFRQGDVVSIKYGNKYCAAFVHENYHCHEAPIIEFYDKVFDFKPTYKDLHDAKAWGKKGKISNFCIFGMTDLEDRANQIHLIKACADAPSNTHLAKRTGDWSGSSIFEIQAEIKTIVESNH